MTTEQRAAKIKLVLFDVDGVLTDGKILMHADGSESKTFDIKDGTGIVWALRQGLTVGFLSARSSAATAQRAAQLGVTLVHQGVRSKLDTYDQISLAATKQKIFFQIQHCSMPPAPRPPLSAAERDTILSWLVCGAMNN